MNRTEQENFLKDLLWYGIVKANVETEEKGGFRRIRVFEYQGKKYFHMMFNGEVIECYEV